MYVLVCVCVCVCELIGDYLSLLVCVLGVGGLGGMCYLLVVKCGDD